MVKKITTLLLILIVTSSAWGDNKNLQQAAPAPLSEEATISLLTSGPSELAIFTAWGHTAIRVCDPEKGLDVIFNYGIFSFGEPISFVARFVSGQTDYRLGCSSMQSSINETTHKNADYYEQVLNLTKKEKEYLYGMLLENYKPENRIYRYKYFSDNCATRPRTLISQCINGTLEYQETSRDSFKKLFHKKDGNKKTYRDLIYELLATSPWYVYGIDLCLGKPTDETIESWDQLFLPIHLKEEANTQSIRTESGTRPLVKENTQLLEKERSKGPKDLTTTFNPQIVFWTIFLFSLLHALYYTATGKDDRWCYFGAFMLMGLVGTLIFYVSCLSVHEYVFPNYNLLWLNPLQLIIALFIFSKRFKKIETALMYIAGIGCVAALFYFIIERMSISSFTGMQHFNNATLPSILTETTLIIAWLWRRRVNVKKNVTEAKKGDKKS